MLFLHVLDLAALEQHADEIAAKNIYNGGPDGMAARSKTFLQI